MNEFSELRPGAAYSVGSIVKKIVTIHPELGTHDLIQIMRQATKLLAPAGALPEEPAFTGVVNESLALKLAKELAERRGSKL